MDNNSSRRRFIKTKDESPEEAKIKRRALLFGFLTVVIVISLLLWGVPFLIRFAVFLGELKSETEPPVAEDTIPPLPPQFSPLPEATNSATIKVAGFTEKGAEVEVYLNNQLLTKVASDDKGEFQLEKVVLNKGENTLFAYAYDKAGNKSDLSEKIKIIFDDQPPSLTITSPEEEEKTVYEPELEVKGETDSEEVKVTVNDHVVLLEKGGKFTYRVVLAEGKNEIKVVAEDPAGNKTEKTLIIHYHL